MKLDTVNQLRQLVLSLARAGHINSRQGRTLLDLLDEYKELMNEAVRSEDTPKPKTRNKRKIAKKRA